MMTRCMLKKFLLLIVVVVVYVFVLFVITVSVAEATQPHNPLLSPPILQPLP